MKVSVEIEVKKVNEGGDGCSRETIYEQKKEFEDFDVMKVINAFNDAEKANEIFVVDPAKMPYKYPEDKEKK